MASKSKDPAHDADCDTSLPGIIPEPGVLRKVCFPFKDLKTAFSYVEELGRRRTEFAKSLDDFFAKQGLTLAKEPVLSVTREGKRFWTERTQALKDLRSACAALQTACAKL